jgi:hypothetical protein
MSVDESKAEQLAIDPATGVAGTPSLTAREAQIFLGIRG